MIENVIVDEQARKSRIGSIMMRHAIALAQARECFRVVLSSSVDREGSHKFYRTLGSDVFGYNPILASARNTKTELTHTHCAVTPIPKSLLCCASRLDLFEKSVPVGI